MLLVKTIAQGFGTLSAGVKWSPDGACLLTANDDNWSGIN